MELKGKSKDRFNKWYEETYGSLYGTDGMPSLHGIPYECRGFENFNSSMKFGVFLEFLESEGIIVEIFNEFVDDGKSWYFCVNDLPLYEYGYNGLFDTVKEAQEEAIKVAFGVLEESLNNKQ